jgi:peptidoglycan/LPS O-acetylase OafA/YrhL
MIYLYLPFLVLIVLLSVYLTNKVIKLKITEVKYPEIDGIRGYLAFFVFLHHSYIWSVYLRTNKWEMPMSNLFNHFGQTSVSLFFIITAFLFTTKLLNNKTQDFEWGNYIRSRFFRMFPMYFFSIIFVFIIILFESNFEQKTNAFFIFENVLSWLFFTLGGSTDINEIKNTFVIDAGVTWTLPYEWLFYFLLPLLALAFKIKVNLKTIVSYTIISVTIAVLNEVSFANFIPFLGGVLSAILIHYYDLKVQLKKNIFSLIGISLVILSIIFTHRGNKPIPVLISTLFFIIIASGNSIFGFFSSLLSRKLGQITYSIYLTHGIVLFVVFRYLIGFKKASKLSELEHWGVIALCIFPIIFISQLTFIHIELPFINLKKKINLNKI